MYGICRAFSARWRPTAIHCPIAASSAPAAWHSSASARYPGACSLIPAWANPRVTPACSARRSAQHLNHAGEPHSTKRAVRLIGRSARFDQPGLSRARDADERKQYQQNQHQLDRADCRLSPHRRHLRSPLGCLLSAVIPCVVGKRQRRGNRPKGGYAPIHCLTAEKVRRQDWPAGLILEVHREAGRADRARTGHQLPPADRPPAGRGGRSSPGQRRRAQAAMRARTSWSAMLTLFEPNRPPVLWHVTADQQLG